MIYTDRWVLLTAPKTGSTALHAAALTPSAVAAGVRCTPEDMHLMPLAVEVAGRQIFIAVRDPRERLVSLWQHYRTCRNGREQTDLGEFVRLLSGDNTDPFFSKRMADYYDRYDDAIPLELEHWPFSLPPELPIPLRLNCTTHPPWYKCDPSAMLSAAWWWRPDAQNYYPEILLSAYSGT